MKLVQGLILGLLAAGLLSNTTSSQEKLKFGTPGTAIAVAFLPQLAAQEQGLWQKNGLEVEWVPFRATTALTQAVAGGWIKVGSNNAVAIIPAIARGLPGLLVAEYQRAEYFSFYVLAKSPIKVPHELRGAKIGVSSLGGTSHMTAQLMVRALGLEKQVKFVAVGGVPQGIAGLKAGAVDATITSIPAYVELIVKGEVRPVGRFEDLVKERRIGTTVFARKDFINEKPDEVARVVKATAQTGEFLQRNRSWGIEKIKSHAGFSQKAAEVAYDVHLFTGQVRLDAEGMENVRRSLIEFGLIPAKETPPAKELYTNRFAE